MTNHLTITNHLGLNLDAIFDAPLVSPGPQPLVILLHGHTGWKEEEHIASLAQGLADAGIAALRFDTVGSGKSQGTWAEHYRASNYLSDVDSVYDYALYHLNTDPERVGIWGHSYGGMIAVYAAAAHPRRFRAVCGSQLSSGQTSLAGDKHKVEAWQKTGWMEFPSSHFGPIKLPYAFFNERENYHTAEEIKKIHEPLLLIAGTKDKNVPAKTVRQIYDAANEPKQYLEVETDHGYKHDPVALGRINRTTVQFFQKQLA